MSTKAGTEADLSNLVVDLAARIYGGHIHAGRACVTLQHALYCAATIVGAAQSAATLKLIERARGDPMGSLDDLRKSQAAFAQALDADRQRELAVLAAALKNGEEH